MDTVKRKAEVLEILEQTLGVVTTACKKAKISRSTFYMWLENDSDFKKSVQDVSEIAIDFVESQLYSQIKDHSTAATIFYLKTKGKKRGYVERSELEVSGGDKPITINLEIDE